MATDTTEAEITKAIGAHGMWKNRLAGAINAGAHTEDVATVAVDNKCEFGRWLYGFTPAAGDQAHYQTCKKLHAAFHAEAAKTLRLVSAGQKAQAQAAMAPGGSFTKASGDLTKAMIEWRAAKR